MALLFSQRLFGLQVRIFEHVGGTCALKNPYIWEATPVSSAKLRLIERDRADYEDTKDTKCAWW